MAFLKILRPFNCLFVLLCVIFGAVYQAPLIFSTAILFAMLSATLIAGAGYVINDFFDLPIDVINRPERILPAKKMSPSVAYLYAVILFIMGIIFSFFTGNIFCVLLAILNSLVLFFYAKTFKMTYLAGNILVAYASSSTFIFGGFAGNNLEASFIIAIYAFIFTLIREIIKDAEDVKGDKLSGGKTFAVVHGQKISVYVTLIISAVMVIYTILLFKYNYLNIYILILLMIVVHLPLFYTLITLRNGNNKQFHKMQNFMKLDMLFLLIILGIGTL